MRIYDAHLRRYWSCWQRREPSVGGVAADKRRRLQRLRARYQHQPRHHRVHPFSVLSASPATLTLSSPVKSQGQVTVTGANFLPGGTAVEVFYGLSGSTSQSTGSASAAVCTQSVGTKTADAKGGFTLTFQAPFVSVNSPVTVTAVSPQATCGGTPVLMAAKTVTVLAASSATVTATATSQSNSFINGFTGTNNQVWPPSGIWSVVDCLVGLLLFLLLLLALLVASRNRGQASNQRAQASSAGSSQGAQAGGRLMDRPR